MHLVRKVRNPTCTSTGAGTVKRGGDREESFNFGALQSSSTIFWDVVFAFIRYRVESLLYQLLERERERERERWVPNNDSVSVVASQAKRRKTGGDYVHIIL